MSWTVTAMCIVGVSVSLSATTLAATAFLLTRNVRCVDVYDRIFLSLARRVFEMNVRSNVMSRKSQFSIGIVYIHYYTSAMLIHSRAACTVVGKDLDT